MINLIVGFSIDKIESEKGELRKGNVNVNYSPEIKEVEAAESPAFDEKLARVLFRFVISYEQEDNEVGRIEFEGNLIWKGKVEEMLEEWEEEEGMPEDIGKALINNLYKRGITQAVGIADSMDLPSPVPLPKVQKG